jgi:hypothetical protein
MYCKNIDQLLLLKDKNEITLNPCEKRISQGFLSIKSKNTIMGVVFALFFFEKLYRCGNIAGVI